MKLTGSICLLYLLLLLTGCHSKTQVDLIVTNATIYLVDSSFSTAEAMAITNGKVVETGSATSILATYQATETIDAQGNFIYPGFNDAHCHFLAYGRSLNECDLTGTNSWKEVLERLTSFAAEHKDGWLIGRGWDQNDWDEKSFPVNDLLNKLFPAQPVALSRVDGHALIVNDYALRLSKITNNTNISGGEIIVLGNKPTGVLIDNATSLVEAIIPLPNAIETTKYLQAAERKCFEAGLTSVQDCGLDALQVLLIDSLDKNNLLSMRINAMLSDNKANYEWAFAHGKIKTDKLHAASFKLYADGALGSRGACLLQAYNDLPGHYGFLLQKLPYYDSILNVIASKDWQACTHAIGDSANRLILNLYKKHSKPNARWRIEHAQVINEMDFDLFKAGGVVPSVQPTHATSDMYWAGKRIGSEREKGAYAYQKLLKQLGWLPLGTDFPVEDISPIKTFYAAVVRKDAKGYPDKGYQIENALTRQEALRGMTIWASKASFEENEKGSLTKGMFADFVVLNQDIMKAKEIDILQTKVVMTYSGGKQVFKGK